MNRRSFLKGTTALTAAAYRGFGKAARNLAFHVLEGNEPHSLRGKMVNSTDSYGAAAEKGADGATWKACGQECIDGTFYAL